MERLLTRTLAKYLFPFFNPQTMDNVDIRFSATVFFFKPLPVVLGSWDYVHPTVCINQSAAQQINRVKLPVFFLKFEKERTS